MSAAVAAVATATYFAVNAASVVVYGRAVWGRPFRAIYAGGSVWLIDLSDATLGLLVAAAAADEAIAALAATPFPGCANTPSSGRTSRRS